MTLDQTISPATSNLSYVKANNNDTYIFMYDGLTGNVFHQINNILSSVPQRGLDLGSAFIVYDNKYNYNYLVTSDNQMYDFNVQSGVSDYLKLTNLDEGGTFATQIVGASIWKNEMYCITSDRIVFKMIRTI